MKFSAIVLTKEQFIQRRKADKGTDSELTCICTAYQADDGILYNLYTALEHKDCIYAVKYE